MVDDETPELPPLADPDAGDESPKLTLGEAADTDDAAPVEEPKVYRDPVLTSTGEALGTGRRKTAVARVRVKVGGGTITVNGRDFNEFFVAEKHRHEALAPLRKTELAPSIDIRVRVAGGGPSGQAGAVSLGIARALCNFQPRVEEDLRDAHLMTRDSRMVERKKYGRKKARKSFQFSKR